MKKFTDYMLGSSWIAKSLLLLVVCLSGLTANATLTKIYSLDEIVSGKTYIIQNVASGNYVQFDVSITEEDLTGSGNWANKTPLVSSADDATAFILTGSEGSYTLKNSDGYYVSTGSKAWNTGYSSDAMTWTIGEVSTADGTFSFLNPSTSKYWKYDGSNAYIYIDGTTSNNYTWYIYSYKDDGVRDNLIDAINDATAKASTEAFYYDPTQVKALTDAAQEVYDNADATDDEITAAITALNDGMAALTPNPLESGRYFIQNYKTITSDGKTVHPYLTNEYNLMGVGPQMVSYYSIWDVNKNDDGTYTIQNEGQRFLGKPMDLENVDKGYMGYQVDANNILTHFGCFTDGSTEAITLDINPLQFGYVGYAGIQTHSAIDEKNYAPYIDMFADGTNVGDDNADTNAASIDIMASTLTSVSSLDESIKQAFLWSFTKLTSAAELAMFEDQVQNSLLGYVGGVSSISYAAAQRENAKGYDGCDWLQNVIVAISAAENKLSNNKGSGAQQDDEGSVGGATYMKTIFTNVLKNRTSANASDLHIQLEKGKSFYFENMRGDRPATYSQLHANGTSNYCCTANPESDLNSYLWFIEDATTGYYGYTVDASTKSYLMRSSDYSSLWLTPGTGSNMDFDIVQVTPSIFLIKDNDYDAAKTDGKKYITVSGDSPYPLVHYNYIELSSLWKLETINTTPISLNADPEDRSAWRAENMFGSAAAATIENYTNAGKYDTENSKFLDIYGTAIENDGSTYGAENRCYTTYCPAIDMVVPSTADYTAYYVPQVTTKAGNRSDCTVVLKAVTKDSGKQYLKAGSGYVVVLNANSTVQESTISRDLAFSDKSSDDVTAPTPNLLKGTLSNIFADDQYSMAVLNYVATGSYTFGKQACGVGIGFYNLKSGSMLASGKAYLDLKNLTLTQVSDDTEGEEFQFDTTNGVAAMKFLMEDEEGNETGIGELNADGTMTFRETAKSIYDLSGRRVGKANKGIYIVNGKKVIY